MIKKAEFKDRLRQLREEKGLTQTELGMKIGSVKNAVSYYENGIRSPRMETLILLSSIFHVSADYLIGIEKGESVDISSLSENEKSAVRALIYKLALKEEEI